MSRINELKIYTITEEFNAAFQKAFLLCFRENVLKMLAHSFLKEALCVRFTTPKKNVIYATA